MCEFAREVVALTASIQRDRLGRIFRAWADARGSDLVPLLAQFSVNVSSSDQRCFAWRLLRHRLLVSWCLSHSLPASMTSILRCAHMEQLEVHELGARCSVMRITDMFLHDRS
jgi:hypothetical protein